MNVYVYITPIVLILLLLEILYSYQTKKGLYPFQDTVSNLGTGIGNQCINLAVVFFVYKWYGFIYELTPLRIGNTWYTMILLLLLQDFVFYWFHRVGHRINIFWAAHMAHHSSEEMNLSVGIRASFTQRLFQFMFFDWVLVLVGFSPETVYAMAAVHLLLAYWHHTAVINKMGWIEKYFVTPSHHRVHHGVNPQYIDKNFSEFLIIWDKMFGTFEPEVEELCYGVTHPPRTWNPISINFQFWKQLVDDAAAAPFWWDKIRIWFMPTGWRPRGLEQFDLNAPIGYTKAEQTKFQSIPLGKSRWYLVFQITIGLIYLFITINLGFPLSGLHRIILSAGVFFMIIGWSGVLESKSWARNVEVLRSIFMAGSLMWVLHDSGLSPIQNWSTILILLLAGINILWVSFYVERSSFELIR